MIGHITAFHFCSHCVLVVVCYSNKAWQALHHSPLYNHVLCDILLQARQSFKISIPSQLNSLMVSRCFGWSLCSSFWSLVLQSEGPYNPCPFPLSHLRCVVTQAQTIKVICFSHKLEDGMIHIIAV